MIRLCYKSLIAFVNNKREFGVLVFAVEELVGNCHQFCMVACCFEHISLHARLIFCAMAEDCNFEMQGMRFRQIARI
jgi:hypothetical protein